MLTVSWSPDGKSLVTVDRDRSKIQIWDAGTLKVKGELRGHTGIIVDAQFAPNSNRVGSISYDGTVRIWDSEALTSVAVLQKHSDRVLCMAFSPDGKYLVTGGLRRSREGTVIVWNMQTLSVEGDLKHSYDVGGVTFVPDSKCLVTSDRYNVYAWDTHDWRYVGRRSRRGEYPLDTAVYSPDGKNAITMNLWGDDLYTKLRLWKRADDGAGGK